MAKTKSDDKAEDKPKAKAKSGGTISVTTAPEGDIAVGTYVTVRLTASGDEDNLGEIRFEMTSPTVQSSVFLGYARVGAFYAQDGGPFHVSFTDADGKAIASKKL